LIRVVGGELKGHMRAPGMSHDQWPRDAERDNHPGEVAGDRRKVVAGVDGYDVSPPNGRAFNRERRESDAIKSRNHHAPLAVAAFCSALWIGSDSLAP